MASEEEGGHLGSDIGSQILGQPKALAIAAAMLVLIGIVPGMPKIPFFVLAITLGGVAYKLMKADKPQPAAAGAGAAAKGAPGAPPDSKEKPAGQKAEPPSPILTPIALELSPALGNAFNPDGSGGRFVKELLPLLRERVFNEMGIPLPAVRIRPGVPNLGPNGYAIRLQEVTMGKGDLVVGGGLCSETPERLTELGLRGTAAQMPEGGTGAWIAAADLPRAKAANIQVLGPEEVVIRHLIHLVRRYGYEFIGIQEAQVLIDGLERTHPALVREVVPKLVSPVLLSDVLRRLAEEGVSLRGLREILGALAEWAPVERDPVALTEHVRSALRRQITSKYIGPTGALPVYLLDPMIEETIRESIHKTPTGSYLALEPALSRDILAAVGRTLGGVGQLAVILTSAEIRRYVRRLVEAEFPQLAVLSYQELSPETQLQPLGRIKVS